MNNTCKRLLSLVMAIVMVMSYGVVPVAADDTVECSHEGATETITATATCTTDGAKTFKCGSCEAEWTETIPSSGHSYAEEVTTAATCTEEGVKTFTCGNCGDSYTETISAAGHNYAETVTTAATCTTDGVKTFTCGNCGDTYTDTIAATGHSYVDGECACGAKEEPAPTCVCETKCNEQVNEACAVCMAGGTCAGETAEETPAPTQETEAVCDGTENCPAAAHEETCDSYNPCEVYGCTAEAHHADCPWGPCTLTEGCQLVKGHELLGAPCDIGLPFGSTTISSSQINMSDSSETFISAEIFNLNATSSVIVNLYSGEKLIAFTELQKPEYYKLGTVGVKFIITGEPDSWKTTWEKDMPRADYVPDRMVLLVDGDEETAFAEVHMIATGSEAAVDWATVPGVKAAPVAEIDGIGYETLAKALDEAEDGDTIELVWKEGDAPIAMAGKVVGNKTVTITGTATVNWGGSTLYVGREGAGNGKLIFKDAKLTSNSTDHDHGIHVSGAKADANTNNGVLEIIDSEIELEYLINRNEINVSGNSKLTVNYGFYNHGRNADESADGNAKTAVFNIGSGSSVTIINEGNMGIGGESYGTLNINGGSFTAQNYLNVRANGTVNINSGSLSAKTIYNNGTINVNGGNLNISDTMAYDGDMYVNGESTLNIKNVTTTKASGNEIGLNDGAIIKDSSVGGSVLILGEVTFRGENTFTMIEDYGAAYSSTSADWTIEPGASVTVTSTERYGLGYGDAVFVCGELKDAMSARGSLSEEDADLNLYGGLVGMTNSGFANTSSKFTAENAYLIFGTNGDKSIGNKSDYYGNYQFNFNNTVVTANGFKFYQDNGKSTVNFSGSDLLVSGHFMTNDADSKFTFTNSRIVSLTTVPGNEDANKNAGELILDNTPVTYNAIFTNTGTVVLKNGSKLTAPQVVNTADGAKIQIDGSAGYKDGDVVIDVTTAFTEETFKNIEVINNGALKVKLNDAGDVVIESAAAQVGDEYFDDLQEAIDAAAISGDPVVLLKDASGSGLSVGAGKNVTINLNDNDLTLNATAVNMSPGPAVTVEGQLTINGTGNVTAAGAAILPGVPMTFGSGIKVTESGKLIVNGGNYSFSGHQGSIALVCGTIEINGGSFTSSGTASLIGTETSATVIITAGDFSKIPIDSDAKTIAISGGTFGTGAPVPEEFCAEGYIPVMKDGVYTVKQGAFHAKIVRTVEGTDPVETIDVKFELLAEAIEAAEVGETVILLKDCAESVTINKEIQLDLGGKAATGTITLSHLNATVKGEAGMTNIDTTVADYKVVYKDDIYKVAIPVAQIGQFYYETLQDALDAAKDGKDTVILVNEVVLTEPAIVNKSVELDMNGKKISNATPIWNEAEKDWSLISVQQGGLLTITGNGTVEALANDCFAVDVREDGQLVVQNGTFKGNISAIYVLSGDAQINGGTYSVQQTDNNGYSLVLNINDGSNGSISVSGGTFVKHDPSNSGDGNLVMDGKCTIQNGDNFEVVDAGASVFANGEMTFYYSLADAAAAAKDMSGEVSIAKLNNNAGTDANEYPVTLNGPVTINCLGKNMNLAVKLDGKDMVSVSRNGVVTVTAKADDDSDYGSFIFAKLTTDKNGQPDVIEQVIFVEDDTKFVVDNASTFELDKDVDFDGEYMLDDGDGVIDEDDVTATFVDKNDNPLYVPEIKQGEKVTLVARSTAFFDTCTKIYVDSERVYTKETGSVNKNNFLVSEGCTELELTAQYVKTLPAGKHSVKFYHVIDGKEYETAKIYFKIIADDSKADPTNPKTGDFIMMPMAIMTLSAAALAVLLIGKKKHA